MTQPPQNPDYPYGQQPQHPSNPYGQQPAPTQPPTYGQGSYGSAQAYPPAQQYGAAPPVYGAPQEQHPGTNGFAIAGFITGLIGLCFLGLPFSIVGLNQTKSRPQAGRGLAIAGLVLSILWLVAVGALIAIGAASDADRDSNGAIQEKGSISSSDIREGDCINLPDKDKTRVLRVDAVPCNQPHDAEAFARFSIGSGSYPGDQESIKLTEDGCISRVEAFVGRGAEDSKLSFPYFYPPEDAWKQGDRMAVCLVGEATGKTTLSSLRGANR